MRIFIGNCPGSVLVILTLIKFHYVGISLASGPDSNVTSYDGNSTDISASGPDLNVTNQVSNNCYTNISRNSTRTLIEIINIFTATNVSEIGENITSNGRQCPQIVMTSVFVPLMAVTICLGIWSIVANGLPLAAIMKHERLHKPVYILIANLAASDVLAGVTFVLVGSSVLYSKLSRFVPSVIISHIQLTALLLSGLSSAYSLLALTAERYWFIVHGMTYVNKVTNERCKVAVVVVWVWSLLVAMPPNFWWQCVPCVDERCLPLGGSHGGVSYSYVVVILVTVFTPMAAIVLLNMGILSCLWKHVNAIAAQEAAVGAQPTTSRKSTVTIVLITAVFLVGWTPLLSKMAKNTQDIARLHETQVFVLLNSAINPVIYALRLREVRRCVVRLFVNPGGNAA
ncbi:melanocortin receptor 5-like [Branchiostoma lanceolatum]|uniref:melanocortin receptor 5-like n=1 Tax=Branchiostoma lanceolatum TaxID=7740 RepID=UPI0034514FB9